MQVFRDGKPEAPKVEALKADQTKLLVVPGVARTEVVFLTVKRVRPLSSVSQAPYPT